MICATAVAAEATRNRPGSARISIGREKRWSNSALIVWAKPLKCGDDVIVVGGEAATDVEDLDLEAARPGLWRRCPSRQVQGLDVVLDVGALAADVEAQPLLPDLELVVAREGDQVHGFAR